MTSYFFTNEGEIVLFKFAISCCSTVDLTANKLKSRNVNWISFPVVLNGKQFKDDMFSTLSPKEYYDNLLKGNVTTTSQINVEEYNEHFEKLLKEYSEVVHVSMSSNLSGTYNNAITSAKGLNAKYKNKHVYVINSLCTSSGYGMLVEMLADLRDKGLTAFEAVNYCEDIKHKIHTDFFVSDLNFLVKGGRVSKASAIVGNILKIFPILFINADGKLELRKKVRGKNMAFDDLINNMLNNCNGAKKYDGKCFVSHSDCEQDAKRLIDLIEGTFPNLKGKVELFSIGPTTGSHTGPHTLALFYIGNER